MVDIRYAKSAGASIAYRVVGEAALDLVYVPDFVSNLVYAWESSYWRGFYERLARSFRLILFDKRGTGLSDGGGHGTRGRFGARRRSWRACAASGSRCGSGFTASASASRGSSAESPSPPARASGHWLGGGRCSSRARSRGESRALHGARHRRRRFHSARGGARRQALARGDRRASWRGFSLVVALGAVHRRRFHPHR